ncbi:hypothetical protein AAFF_G00189800 [Aldrovandia affinis]|uniref:Uncharacterized protein n=1 Tax=Aldrovandia affinis TaxID=143900 RepID=A0AAD7RJI2_9TELE|nr:hypothetical protein AAFF_G00189800 [Aldrovandia affinis]
MTKTFSLRRQEVVEQKPMIADFKNRWPELFQVIEVDIDLKRDSILERLRVYLNEDSEAFVKEYLDCTVSVAEEDMLQTVMGIYVVRKAGTKDNNVEDVGIMMEGVSVLNNLATVYNAFIMLFGLIYALDLSFPVELKYTFEFFQKILMELDGHKLTRKLQQLNIKMFA